MNDTGLLGASIFGVMSSMGRFSRRVVDVLIKHTRLIEYDILRHACTAIRIVIINNDNRIRRYEFSCVRVGQETTPLGTAGRYLARSMFERDMHVKLSEEAV